MLYGQIIYSNVKRFSELIALILLPAYVYGGARCGGHLTQSAGDFFSPEFPDRYPNNIHCEWKLKGPDRQIVSLSFTFVE